MKRTLLLALAAAMLLGLGVTAQAAEGGSDRETIEKVLNLANNADQTWSYSDEADAWTLEPVSAVAWPELPDQQGVSVCVPGTYVTGIDTDGDGAADVTAEDADDSVQGGLVIDYDAQIVSPNGQTYTAATAPVILNTGAAGYGSQNNSAASSEYAADGYINVSCGNRGKQDTATDSDGGTYYTGDAPSCLADQKAAARYVKYNILLGNLPGDIEKFISTGGSGGGAHAVMFAATGNHPDFYDYQIEAGAVGVYKNADGTYDTTVTVDGADYDLSDGAWGCIAYSPITSLAEGDMAMAFEYYMDTAYDFGTPFQKQLAEYLSQAYMDYINGQDLTVEESAVGFDLDGDGALSSTVPLTIECDMEHYPETNGYHGTYLDLYLAEFTENLQWYLDNLDCAEGWTWFDENGDALSDEAVASMTGADKAQAFLEGRYAKGASGGMMDGKMGGMRGGGPMDGGMAAGGPNGTSPDGEEFGGKMDGQRPEGGMPADGMPNMMGGAGPDGGQMLVGTPDAGTTQSATGGTDSRNYTSYEEMVTAYEADIAEIAAGDKYGNNIVALYDPLNYIGAADTDAPVWTRIMMGAAEGDMSMFASLNLQIAWLNAGTDAELQWQWDGGHVPSEVLGESFSLYVDEMVAKHAGGAAVEKQPAQAQTANGTAAAPTGTDLTGWVDSSDIENVTFSLAGAAAYRVAGASKAIPGFDVIDYGQEDYVFGSPEKDARHWNTVLLEIFQAHADTLEPLFNQSSSDGTAQDAGGPAPSSGMTNQNAVVTYSEDTAVSGEEYTSTGTDENAILIADGAVTLDQITVDRTSSDSTGGDNASFYGTGAAILATGGEADITGAQITTDAKGGAGVFAYGDGVVHISDSTIATAQDTSGGIHAAGGGTLYATNVTATTDGESSAAIRSDRGGGLMVVSGGSYTSNGVGSPAIYCTATIAAEDAELAATGSEAVCIEGLNSLYLYDCDLTGTMRDSQQNDCTWNVILYQSMSGDSQVGNSTFQMTGGTLTAKNGGMFYTTNTESTFILKDVQIVYAEDSPFFLRCTGNQNQRGWGQTGSNGADCTFTAIGQDMVGNVVWDSISSLDLYVTEGSVLTGAVVQDESCAGSGGDGYAALTIDAGSQWVVTGDSVLTSLHNGGSVVDEDGHTVTIQGTDGTVYVGGDGKYTVTVSAYDEDADLSGAGTVTTFENAQVNTGSQTSGSMDGMGDGGTPPEKPDGNTPPDMPQNDMDNGGTPPDMPQGGMDNGNTPPEPPQGGMDNGSAPPERPDGGISQQPPNADTDSGGGAP